MTSKMPIFLNPDVNFLVRKAAEPSTDDEFTNATTDCVTNDTLYYEFNGSLPYWTIIDVFLMFIILTGNILTILAVTLTRRLSKRTANKCVLNLAVSDLIVGLTLPYHIAFYQIENLRDGRETCLAKFFLIIFACSASIVNVIVVAIDRYIAILYPLHYTKYMSKLALRTLMVFGWMLSIGFSIVPVFWNDWKLGITCDMHKVIPRLYSAYVLTPLFTLMWSIMSVVYWKIWREVVSHTRRMRVATCNPTMKRDWKSLQVVLIILGSFTICWMPFVIVVCVQVINERNPPSITLYMTLFCLAKANSGINPIIYAWKNGEFRRAFLRLIRCKNPNYRSSGRKLHDGSSNCTDEKIHVKTISKRVQESELVQQTE